MHRALSIIVLLFSFWPAGLGAEEYEKVVYTRAFVGKAYGYYHAQVLKAALRVTPEFGMVEAVPHPQPMPQARQILVLRKGNGDVMWAATSDRREETVLPVRFPLLMGFSGYRVLVIRQGNQQAFPRDLSLAQLKQKVAVQGNDWPDLQVLLSNGFQAKGAAWSTWFVSMFVSVQKGIVDYFPRNVIEVSKDLARHNDKNLALEQHHIVRYPNYEYFFVSPKKPELVTRLKVGLKRLLKSGELRTLFMNHENHRNALLLASDPNRVIHDITNPLTSYEIANPIWIRTPQETMKELLDNSN